MSALIRSISWIIFAVTLVAACAPVEDSDEFEFWQDRFFSDKYERSKDGWYDGFAWYEPPPWTERQAVEQLAHEIAVGYPLEDGTGFAVFDGVLDGRAEPIGERGWRVSVPPIAELDIDESVWEIWEAGGYRYMNKPAAQIAACLHIDLGESLSDPDKTIRLNIVGCPAD